jgi:hypothetical protein
MSQHEEMERLQEENRRLRTELEKVAAEKEAYRRFAQKLLPADDVKVDEEELARLLNKAGPQPTFLELIREIEGEVQSSHA